MKYVYHVSTIGGLKELKPHASSHGVPYVYATENPVLALLWGSKKSHRDLDGDYGTTKIGEKRIPLFMEAYKDSFRKRFEGESCFIYTVLAKNFEHKTGFKGEVVSETPVKVISCTIIDDVYNRLNEEIKNENMIFYKYDEKDKEYVKFANNYLLYKIIASKIHENKDSNGHQFAKETFPKILAKAIKFSQKNGENSVELARKAFKQSYFKITLRQLKREK